MYFKKSVKRLFTSIVFSVCHSLRIYFGEDEMQNYNHLSHLVKNIIFLLETCRR